MVRVPPSWRLKSCPEDHYDVREKQTFKAVTGQKEGSCGRGIIFQGLHPFCESSFIAKNWRWGDNKASPEERNLTKPLSRDSAAILDIRALEAYATKNRVLQSNRVYSQVERSVSKASSKTLLRDQVSIVGLGARRYLAQDLGIEENMISVRFMSNP